MEYMFLDESGDCSFSDTSIAEHFVITVVTVNKYEMKKIKNHLKRVFVDIYSAGWNKSREVKAYDIFNDRKFGQPWFEKIFGCLTNIGSLKVNYIVVRKKGLESETFKKAPYGIAYNYFTGRLLSELIFEDKIYSANLTFDKRNKETHDNKPFKEYLLTQINGKAFEEGLDVEFVLRPEDSQFCYGLIAADFFSWGIFRKIEYGDETYFDLFSSKIHRRQEWYIKK